MKFDANFPESGIPAFHKISFRFLARRSRIPRPTPHVKTSNGGKEKTETMTTTEQITNVATALGWSVETDASRPGFTEFEFRQYTPAGQDFGFSVEMRNGDPDSLLQELEKYYEAYDSDYEAYLWIGTDGHGKNGAPYHIKDIVSDMEAAEAMIDTLYETLKTALK